MPLKSLLELYLNLIFLGPNRSVRFASHSLAILREAALYSVLTSQSQVDGLDLLQPRIRQACPHGSVYGKAVAVRTPHHLCRSSETCLSASASCSRAPTTRAREEAPPKEETRMNLQSLVQRVPTIIWQNKSELVFETCVCQESSIDDKNEQVKTTISAINKS